MSRTILVAVGPKSPESVLTSAIDLAKQYEAVILALHIVDTRPVYLGPYDHSCGSVIEAMQDYGRKALTQIEDVLRNNAASAEARMVTLPMAGSSIGNEIATLAEASGADLIVLGERQSTWWNWLSENVAREVQRHTSTPIHVVSGEASKRPIFSKSDGERVGYHPNSLSS
jgi:nucleotide-binding universal stress UspA family protein